MRVSLPIPVLWSPPSEPRPSSGPVARALRSRSWHEVRRKEARVPVRVAATWRLDGRATRGWTADISRDGLSVTTDDPPPVSSLIQVDLMVPQPGAGRALVSLMGWVRWGRDNPLLPPPSQQFGAQIMAFRDRTHEARYDAFVASMLGTVIVMEV